MPVNRAVSSAALLALLCAASTHAWPQIQHGRVTHVVDGDTLDVLVGEKRVRVELVEIAAPELTQRYGHRSRQSLVALCGGESATIYSHNKDRSGRTVTRVSCSGQDAGTEQVRSGMARVVDRFAAPDSPLHAVQAEARDARRGLWSNGGTAPPWDGKRSAAR